MLLLYVCLLLCRLIHSVFLEIHYRDPTGNHQKEWCIFHLLAKVNKMRTAFMLFTLQIQKVGPDVIKSFSLICILTLGLQKNCIFLIEFNKKTLRLISELSDIKIFSVFNMHFWIRILYSTHLRRIRLWLQIVIIPQYLNTVFFYKHKSLCTKCFKYIVPNLNLMLIQKVDSTLY